MKVQIADESSRDKPLWLVWGHKAFPRMLCCKVTARGDIWGFSIFRRSPGFRTVGRDAFAWIAENCRDGINLWEFYDDQDEALGRLKQLTDPSKVKPCQP